MQLQTLKVLSYNVYPGTIINDLLLKERTKRQISIIKYYIPDIVCLQEVYDVSLYVNAFKSDYHMIYFGNVRNKLSYCIVRTSWTVSASCWCIWRYCCLIKTHQ